MQTNQKQTAKVNRGIGSFTLESNRVKASQTATHALGGRVISAALGRLFMGLKLSLGWSLQLSTRLYPALSPQPQETCFYLRSQQQNEAITLNKYTNYSTYTGSKNSMRSYQAVEIISREDYLSQFKLMNLKCILGNIQHRVGNKK